jgi:hypothetical protein
MVRRSNNGADNAMILAEPLHCCICVFDVESDKHHYVTFGHCATIF